MSDLALCKLMGWTYAELLELPGEVYAVLVEQANAEARAREAPADE